MTPTQEKYLLVIDKISKDKYLVRNRQIADFLGVKPSSVTEIMDRLVNQNMVQRISYRGVFLTSSGKKQVALLKERRRILSTFLTFYLDISKTESPGIIDELLQVQNPLFFEKLDCYTAQETMESHIQYDS
ncbi:TPA: metal-dependent transcriptional regulator [Enterococcus faecium]|uniref:metal-dependent transcriptional regulator n=1 Tax=Enterococcus TaxID=1350 RepID=UPI000691365C|nr:MULTISPECIES: metal-dependent transcriptional regulator [Enterococcus]HAR1310398.1 metal-dependent transcriptional regulator [Enterococcus faecium]EGO6039675.1 metal-dependent transcriptional regulator [Enterococcus faecalis]EGO7747869.1 metal-dependent transcriptional regulator [Enterococcus faecalis]EIV0118426.1 metal-dependent transcriptional regulator [Enterococcus faecalis]EMC0719257.1 metal-dependent transcriptional regulator [Enterococcus faecalis]